MAAPNPRANTESAEPKGGTIIADRYQVDRLIARGGMAAVYLAHHVKLHRPVALKILSPPPDAEDPQSFEERFRLEAETLASLDHPNIVILHDFGETPDGRFFLAMEYVDGPRLSDLLKDGPLPAERALGLIMQVCAALRYAHKRGVVHRDLKPSNMLVRMKDNGEEQMKVVDFGLVKLTDDQSITKAGLILGSPHCMAPEQIKGVDIDHRADIYATGVLLFRSITGTYPFHGQNSAATMIAHLNQAPPTFFSIAPDLQIPAGLEEIVRKCLEKKPDDRYADMAALMNDLAACMNMPAEQFRSVSLSATSPTLQRVNQPETTTLQTGIHPVMYGVVGMGFALLLFATAIVGIVVGGSMFQSRPAVVTPVSIPVAPVPAPLEVLAPKVVEEAPVVAPPVVEEAPVEEPVPAIPAPKKTVPKNTSVKTVPAQTPKTTDTAKTPVNPDDAPAGYMGLPDDFQ